MWTEEFYFQVLSDNEAIKVNSLIDENIFESLQTQISGITSETVLVISIGALFNLSEGIMTVP